MDKNKHHYIPKFILRNFSKEKNQIFLYRYESKEVLCNSISDAFTKNNLNTLKNEQGELDKNFIEDIYDRIFESKASTAIQKIINDLKSVPPSGKGFTSEDYLHLLRFVVLSNFRSPYALETKHHAIRVNTYAAVYLKFFADYGTVNFPYDLDIPKGWLFAFLDNFDESTKLLIDLKLTLYYHRIPNIYFLLPDQHCIIKSFNDFKFADKNLKIYLPISSNVVVCFERIDRKFQKATCELDLTGVENLNRFFASNAYESFGCENSNYLKSFVLKNLDLINPLKRFDPYSNFRKEKEQIKFEIILKLFLNVNNDNFKDGFITTVNKNHQFQILSMTEFEKLKDELHDFQTMKIREIKL